MKKHLYRLLILLCIVALGVSTYKIIEYAHTANESRQCYHSMQDTAVTEGETDSVPPIVVDFDRLRDINGDIIAWLYCPDSPISYPVLSSKDNRDYLHRLPDGTYNSGGSLFTDCGNSDDFSDPVTIIYGHNMRNDTMLGTLDKYRDERYRTAHPTMYLLTTGGNYSIELIAAFETRTSSPIYTIPRTDEEKNDLVRLITDKANFTHAPSINTDDRYIVLSTCAYSTRSARYVLVGRLVPIQ